MNRAASFLDTTYIVVDGWSGSEYCLTFTAILVSWTWGPLLHFCGQPGRFGMLSHIQYDPGGLTVLSGGSES